MLAHLPGPDFANGGFGPSDGIIKIPLSEPDNHPNSKQPFYMAFLLSSISISIAHIPKKNTFYILSLGFFLRVPVGCFVHGYSVISWPVCGKWLVSHNSPDGKEWQGMKSGRVLDGLKLCNAAMKPWTHSNLGSPFSFLAQQMNFIVAA